jgi:hypothetical protein
MKKISRILALVAALCFFGTAKSNAQEIVVRERMHYNGPEIVRPVAPSPRHVWVREEWRPEGGRYVFHGGYWAAPPRPRAVWVGGHWRHGYRGWVWVHGYWR